MSKELRECPFCNGTHSINVINFFTRNSFRKCDICGAEAPEAKTPEEAAEKWNTRPAEDALKAENERLKEKYITEKALRDAAKYLRRFQDWRTGKDIRTQKDAGIYPADLTDAIDTILFYLGLSEPLTNCDGCKYNGEDQNFEGCIMAGSFGDQSCKFEPKDNEVEE
jgi:hypothetical protein